MGKQLKPDIALKEYWSNNERYADLLNAVLFGGREVIRASQLEERNAEESGILELGDDKSDSITAIRDLFRVIKTALGVEFSLIGIENQDKIHYGMPIRVMNLDARAYDRQWKSLKARYKDEKGMTADEYLSHMRKEDKFLPVVTIVIYYGASPWDGARDLHEVLNIPEELRPFVGNYPMHLVEVVDNQLQFRNDDNRDLFQLLNLVYNKSFDKRKRIQKAQEYENGHDIDEDVINALAAVNHIKITKRERKERLKVGTLFEEIARDSKIENTIENTLEILGEYGEIPENLRETIMRQTDMSTLKTWLKTAARVGSIEDFEKAIGLVMDLV
ncbi:MAG: transposase [Ruminococcus flavefaciens]|nr:transposase [Ruminococcus flavefaciens]